MSLCSNVSKRVRRFNVESECMRILRFTQVVQKTGLSRSSVYGRIRSGDFPAPVPLGAGRAVGFLEREVNDWLASMADRRTAGDR